MVMTSLPPCTFYVMRHAQCESNKWQVSIDEENSLTRNGLDQAWDKRPLFKKLFPKVETVVSSGMSRAIETATMLAGMPEEENQDSRLNEQTANEPQDAHRERVMAALSERLRGAKGKTMFFVAHGLSIRRIFEALEVQEPEVIPNATIFRFDPPRQTGEGWKASRMELVDGRVEGIDPKENGEAERIVLAESGRCTLDKWPIERLNRLYFKLKSEEAKRNGVKTGVGR